MRIVIVGGGVVGHALAEQLLNDKHRLSLVELDNELSNTIAEKLDLQVVSGSGSSPSILLEAGINGADMLLAVTPSNEVNIIACVIAEQYGVEQRIARLRGEEFAGEKNLVDLKKIGITAVIHPEKVLADQVLQFVETPHSVQSANFENGQILMRGYRLTENMPLAGKTPREIRESIHPHKILFSAIVRNKEGMIPDGETVLQPGDILYSLFPRESLERYLSLIGYEKKNRKVIITGDSYSTLELAAFLDKNENFSVTLIDPNREHAEKAAAMFDNIEVLHGDCTEDGLLREINVTNTSFFIAISDSPDYNMLSALLAKAEGVHEVVATTTDTSHNKLYASIGIDHVINPRLTTAREILEMISRGHIGAVVKLTDVDIEAVRFLVDSDSDVAGMQVKNIATKMQKGSMIGVIIRDDKMILPEGETTIEAEDHVIVITHHRNLHTMSKLFRPRKFFKRGN